MNKIRVDFGKITLLFIFAICTGYFNYIYAFFTFGLFYVFLIRIFTRRRVDIGFLYNLDFFSLFIVVLLFSLYMIAYTHQSVQSSLLRYFINPILSFGVGYLLVNSARNDDDTFNTIFNFFIAICAGIAFHSLMNTIVNLGKHRYFTVDYTDPGKVIGATNLGVENVLLCALFPLFLYTKNKVYKIVMLTFIIISTVNSIVIGTRTSIYILAIVAAVSVLIILNNKDMKESKKKQIRRFFFTYGVMALILICVFLLNLFNIRELFSKSNFALRFEDTSGSYIEDPRYMLLQRGFRGLWEYPFGLNIVSYYIHNHWLDIGRVAGIIPALTAFIYNIVMFVRIVKLQKRVIISNEVRILFLFSYISLMFLYLTEPVLEGMPHMFYIASMFEGATVCLTKKYQDKCYHNELAD